MKEAQQHSEIQSRVIQPVKQATQRVGIVDNRNTPEQKLFGIIQRANEGKTPFVDNRDTPQIRLMKTLQRMGMEDEEELQMKPIAQLQSEDEELQMKPVAQLQSEDEELQMKPIVQLQSEDDEPLQGKFETIQQKTNNTGLPDNLKSGVESMSGFSMDDVKVHYNSDKPAQMQAHAYAQGTDIHVAPGQEKHLPHEAWHVVQQMQGRVQPTMQMQGVGVNNDSSLEREADVKGGRATQMKPLMKPIRQVANGIKVIQQVSKDDYAGDDLARFHAICRIISDKARADYIKDLISKLSKSNMDIILGWDLDYIESLNWINKILIIFKNPLKFAPKGILVGTIVYGADFDVGRIINNEKEKTYDIEKYPKKEKITKSKNSVKPFYKTADKSILTTFNSILSNGILSPKGRSTANTPSGPTTDDALDSSYTEKDTIDVNVFNFTDHIPHIIYDRRVGAIPVAVEDASSPKIQLETLQYTRKATQIINETATMGASEEVLRKLLIKNKAEDLALKDLNLPLKVIFENRLRNSILIISEITPEIQKLGTTDARVPSIKPKEYKKILIPANSRVSIKEFRKKILVPIINKTVEFPALYVLKNYTGRSIKLNLDIPDYEGVLGRLKRFSSKDFISTVLRL